MVALPIPKASTAVPQTPRDSMAVLPILRDSMVVRQTPRDSMAALPMVRPVHPVLRDSMAVPLAALRVASVKIVLRAALARDVPKAA